MARKTPAPDTADPAELAESSAPAEARPRACISVTVRLPAGFRLDNGIVRPAGEYDLPPEVASPIVKRWPHCFVRKNYEE